MSGETLRACPFCGAAPSVETFARGAHEPVAARVTCPRCHAATQMKQARPDEVEVAREAAIAAWNRRTPESEQGERDEDEIARDVLASVHIRRRSPTREEPGEPETPKLDLWDLVLMRSAVEELPPQEAARRIALGMSDESKRLAEAALAGLAARKDEDVGEWAARLGADIAATPSDTAPREPQGGESEALLEGWIPRQYLHPGAAAWVSPVRTYPDDVRVIVVPANETPTPPPEDGPRG